MRALPWFAVFVAACASRSPAPAALPPPVSSAPSGRLSAAPAPRDDGRLPPTVHPLRYALDLDVDPARERFGGTVRIDVRVPHPTDHIVLHGRGLHVRSASATPTGPDRLSLAATTLARSATHGRGEPEELVLSFPSDLPSGTATVRIEYDAAFETIQGLYRVHSGDDWYAFTQMEPNDARRAFPCFDEPGYKVPWDLTLTVPSSARAVANMPEISRVEHQESHTLTLRFATTPPTSSYLIAFAVGPFEVVEGATQPVPIRAWSVRGQGALTHSILDAARDHVAILSDYFGRAYPYPKLDLLAVPEFGAGAMENPGLITFREELMLLDPARAPTSARRAMASVLAHELAHHWFGDLVTMSWWDDLWLNEGFATWAQVRVLDRWQPQYRASIEALRYRGYAMETDALPSTRAVRQPVSSTSEALEAFDGITYIKGSAVLRMIEHWLGEDVFRSGVRQYVDAHAWQTATARDLLQALSDVSHQDVSAVAESFLDQPGVPLVRAELECAAGTRPSVALSASMYRVASGGASGAPSRHWLVPVCVTYEADGGPQHACALLRDTGTLALEHATRCPRWLHPNADEAGYYRYAITSAVRGMAEPAALRVLDARVRTGLVDNAWALVRSGELGADAFLSLLEGFRSERDRAVLDVIFSALEGMLDGPVAENDRAAMGRWIAGFVGPIAREAGWEPRAGENDERKLLRRAALGLLGSYTEDPWVLAEADRRAEAYLADPRAVDSDVAATAVPLASRRGNETRRVALMGRLAGATTPAERSIALSGLASFENAAVLRAALDETLTDHVRVQDTVRLIYRAWNHPARRATVMAWVREHFDALRARVPPEALADLTGMAAGACTVEQLASEREFYEPRARALEGAERGFRQAVERAEQCIALRGRETDRVHRYLAAHPERRGRR